MPISKTQVDRLGDRLRVGPHTESDLRLLDEYRRSFGDAYEAVVRTLRQRDLFPTGRPAKSTVSIVEKLSRESIRLSQMQDIAGCRVIVPNIAEQEQLVASLKGDFPRTSVVDRRHNPSYGYRAVHIVAEMFEKPIEIQVRTSLQHMWAEVSEKSSDVLDPTIKYGGGFGFWQNYLTTSSASVAAYEDYEKGYFRMVEAKETADASEDDFKRYVANLGANDLLAHRMQEVRDSLEEFAQERIRREEEHKEAEQDLERSRNEIAILLTNAIARLDELKVQKR